MTTHTTTTRTRRAPTSAAADSPAAVLKRAEAKAKRTHWEAMLAQQIKAAHLPEPERNYRWHETQDYESEFAYPDTREKLLVEVDGGLNVGRRNRKQQARDAQEDALAALAGVTIKRPPRGGGHASPDGYERDRIRDAEAIVNGWTVLRVTPSMITSGAALRYLELTLRMLWTRNRKRGAA